MISSMCVLCGADAAGFAEAWGRSYLRCGQCGLTFMAPAQRLDAESERARYDTHRNDPGDAGYRSFLDRLALPLMERVRPPARGLDYGSGPGPTLSVMLEERGYDVVVYDPLYAPDAGALRATYDFVTCTETAEHFFNPGMEFRQLTTLLKPGGWLGVMTELLHDNVEFSAWWYARDSTHVCFYQPRTFEWIAARYGLELETVSRTVVFLRSPTGSR
jgi:hypothetical protein